MLVLPSVDIRGGRCVRLIQGAADRERVYGDDPVAAALRWQHAGAAWVHVVDLDGAFDGRPGNEGTIIRLIRALRVPVEVGGGIRDLATIERYLAEGAARVILGTMAATSPELLRDACARFGDRIAVGIDARGGAVVTQGWVTTTGEPALEAATRVTGAGARRIIYTDTGRDGMLDGPNLAAFEAMLGVANVPVIASGGVASAADVRRLRALEARGLEGVIVGRALYEGRASLEDLLAAAA
ncbi:MAG TPA: 1-(5-phosphoribosyl)-5-[(5-phosphoribosylamino)methylideneamino]imidazole-4-carboxamide isomerase [bacterium]|nr:1-(5-phosphoribosyl)-5-[(5-phosphoribosylamino)methylideneamino]imidazole-4-carboxamide isomerase [bacterium]